jgi:hypothetical protein
MNKRQLMIILIITIFINNCTIYNPQIVPATIIKEKGDLQINGGIFLTPGVHASVGYGLNKCISVQTFASYSLNNVAHFDLSSGWYKNRKKIIFGIYGGYSYGYGNINYKPINLVYMGEYHWIGHYQLLYNKIQLIKTTKRIDFGIVTRFGYLKPLYIKRSFYGDRTDIEIFTKFRKIIEPSFYVNLKSSHRLSITLMGTFSFYNSEYYDNNYFSFGFGFNYIIFTDKNHRKVQKLLN